VASRTLSGVPLSLLLKKIKKERFLLRKLLHAKKDVYSFEYMARCYSLIHEIENLSRNLEKCDCKARICKYSFFLCIPCVLARPEKGLRENFLYAPIYSSLRILHLLALIPALLCNLLIISLIRTRKFKLVLSQSPDHVHHILIIASILFKLIFPNSKFDRSVHPSPKN